MKFSILVSILFASTPAVGFAPNQYAHPQFTSLAYKQTSKNSIDPIADIVDTPVRPSIATPGEDAETTALAASLGIEDIIIRQEYGKWLARYDKTADVTRYPQFKKNFLIQFQNDLKYGKFYTLNEFGDCTEEEFKMIIASQKAKEQEAEKEQPVAIIEEVELPAKKVSTQPTPVVILAAEACQKALKERFTAIAAMSEDTISALADLVCRGGKSSKN